MKILNFELLKHWQNWAIILLMLIIFHFALDIILTKIYGKEDKL